MRVQQLPFGMYLKTKNIEDHRALENEFEALQLIRSQNQIPFLRPLHLLPGTEAFYLLTATLLGQRLSSYIDTLGDDDLDNFRHDMQRYMAQLRSVSRQGEQKHAISKAVGGLCYGYRIVACQD
jgi:hypothetical protein